MNIWIDGDACPKAIKDIIFRAAIRTKTNVIMVANHISNIPPSPYIKRWVVEPGFDVADNKIAEHLNNGDLVITADIVLADIVVTKNGTALNPRGELYTPENIKQTLAMRNLNESLRSSGMISGGAGKMGAKDIQQFSNHLDRLLTKANK
jgi:uncharacterized protein